MKNQASYYELILLGILGFIAYLSLGVYDRVFTPTEEMNVLPPASRDSQTGIQYEIKSVVDKDIFLIAYENDSINRVRNLFKTNLVVAEAQPANTMIEQAITPPPISGRVEPTLPVPTEAVKKGEVLPQLILKGVVLSGAKQALILEVNGKIHLLTTEKPLSSGIELIKVNKEGATLGYKGREITLKFQE